MSTTLEGLPGARQARLGAVSRFFGVLIGPRTVFEDIDRKPSFIFPLAVLTILALLSTFAFVHHVGVDRMMRQRIEQSPQAQQMSSEQIDQAVERSRWFVSVLVWVAALLAPTVLALIASGIYLVALNLMEAGVSVPKVFGATAHAFVPNAIKFLLAGIVILLKDPSDINIENPLGSNLAILLDPVTSSKPLYALAVTFDIFNLWVLALLALGYSVISKKFSFKKCAVIVVIPWLIYVLGKVGLAALMG